MFEALRWTEPGAEYAVLSTRPLTCASLSIETEELFGAGVALFNTPTLLGGQAAKAGLSCASCHNNGRDNPSFVLAQASGKPGTADVTNSFFGAARGNGRFDPVRIPDLTTAGKVRRDEQSRQLEAFIRNLIVEEFDGHEPSAASIDAIASYIRSIENCGEREPQIEPTKLDQQLELISEAILGAKLAVRDRDREGVRLLVAAIRHQLGLISERFTESRLRHLSDALIKESRALQAIGEIGDVKSQGQTLDSWKARFDTGTAEELLRLESKSLYNPQLLAKQFPPQSATPSKH